MEAQERIARIEEMERRLDAVLAAQQSLSRALTAYQAVQEDLHALSAWYESPLWREDYEADETGLLPSELKRGVLAQDTLYALFEKDAEFRTLFERGMSE